MNLCLEYQRNIYCFQGVSLALLLCLEKKRLEMGCETDNGLL